MLRTDVLTELTMFFEAHTAWLVGVTAFSVVCVCTTVVALPVLVARAPVDYFVRERGPRHGTSRMRLVLRNVVGAALFAVGVLMLVLPGQGVLTILVSLTLLEFRGKRRLMRRLVARPGVAAALQWLRKKTHQPPLDLGES